MAIHAESTQCATTKTIVRALLGWFAANARILPWRRTRDPYAIWVSEIMLQQTQVTTVIPYWNRWMRALPTLQAVAKARPAKLRKFWEGLGYYTRVRHLQRAARRIVRRHGGRFPHDFEAILDLPGVGRYTAGAIASIAFNQPRPILDGNVTRVLTRLFAIPANPRERKTNARLWGHAEELVGEASRTHPRISVRKSTRPSREMRGTGVCNWTTGRRLRTCSVLNQSLMELGAVICTPRKPRCPICPVAKFCIARRLKIVEQLPLKRSHASIETRHLIAFLVRRGGRILTRQRAAGMVNGQFWELPQMDFTGNRSRLDRQSRQKLAIKPLSSKPLCSVAHNITRYRIRVDAFPGKLLRPLPGARWFTPAQLQEQAFTGLDRKILRRLLPP